MHLSKCKKVLRSMRQSWGRKESFKGMLLLPAEEQPPCPRYGHATFVHGNEIYIFGGTNGGDDPFGR